MCGITVTHSLHDAHSILRKLQHRGHDAAGIAAIGNNRIDVMKWAGGIEAVDLGDLHKIFAGDYHTFLAHTRYATKGSGQSLLEGAHPHHLGGHVISYEEGSHMIVRDCDQVIVHNGQINVTLTGERESALCDTIALLKFYVERGEREVLRELPGSYTAAIADKRRKDVMVIRDRHGVMPGVLGWKDGKYIVASEDYAITENGGERVEDLDLGSIYVLSRDGSFTKENIVSPVHGHCFFQWNYLADYHSTIDGLAVRIARERLGELLAEEFYPKDISFVTYVPRCPEIAARAYARKLGLPFEPIFFKKNKRRSFQEANATESATSIDENLFLLPHIVESGYLIGKTFIVIDDSTVRGNVARRVCYLTMEEGGAQKVYFGSYTPGIGDSGVGCTKGIDMPPNPPQGREFIVRGRTNEEISDLLGMTVGFTSRAGTEEVYRSLGIPPESMCMACIEGRNPF